MSFTNHENINTFYKVIKSENHFSQLLVNLVNKNQEIKRSVKDFFFSNADYIIDYFDNQKRDKNGQPDILFYVNDLNNRIIGEAIIEVKTQDSKLTDKQHRGEYVNKLLNNVGQKKFLFFLIPKYYEHEMDIKNTYASVCIKKGIDFKIFYWNDLIRQLYKKNSLESNLINEIFNHINDKFGFNKVVFGHKEIISMKQSEIPTILYNLKILIDSVAKKLNYREIKWYNSIDQGGGSYGEGYGFHYKESLWFGYDINLWKNDEAVLIFFTDRNNQKAFNLFDIHFEGFEGKIKNIDTNSKYVDLTEMISEEENVEKIVKIFQSFIEKLDSY